MCNRKCVETLDISIAHKFAFLHSKGITLKANAQTDMIILIAEQRTSPTYTMHIKYYSKKNNLQTENN